MTSIQSSKKVSWLLSILTIATYLCWFVAAGHGAIPMGLLLFLGLFGWEGWIIPVLFGWAGIIVIIVGKFLDRVEPIILGIIFISISWLLILWLSEEILANICTSIPFLICIFFLCRKSLMKANY